MSNDTSTLFDSSSTRNLKMYDEFSPGNVTTGDDERVCGMRGAGCMDGSNAVSPKEDNSERMIGLSSDIKEAESMGLVALNKST